MEQDNLQYRLTGIRELELAYREPFDLKEEDRPQNLEMGIGLRYSWDLTKNIFGVIVNAFYKCPRKDGKEITVLRFSNYTEYEVVDLGKHLKDLGDNKFEMNEQHEAMFVSIAISGARGMLAARTAGTYFGQFVLPIINPMDLLLSKTEQRQGDTKIED